METFGGEDVFVDASANCFRLVANGALLRAHAHVIGC